MLNNEKKILSNNPHTTTRFFLPTLLIANYVIAIPSLLAGLLLIDIGESFGYNVGITGQIQTIASIVGAFSAVLMGAWSMQYRHKSLLLLGVFTCRVSAIGCAIAWNFSMLTITFAISGLGTSIVAPITYTLVGEHYIIERRARTICLLIAGVGLAWLSGPLIISSIAYIGGWRWAFLGFVFPISLLCLAMAAYSMPDSTHRSNLKSKTSKGTYLVGFKQIFTNKSASACLVGMMLPFAGFQAIVVYGASFFRESFHLSTGLVSIIFPILAVFFISGGQLGGRLINRVGRKSLSTFSAVLAGICIIAFMIMPNPYLAIGIMIIGGIFNGMLMTASNSLALEQVPSARGTMMSLTSAARAIGAALGAGIGGISLIFMGYKGVGLILGATELIAALIFYLLVNDVSGS